MTDTRYPVVWVVTSSYHYYPDSGAGDWLGAFFDEDAALECYVKAAGESVHLIVIHNDGSFVEQARK